MTSKKGSFLIPSKMQKELQCVGSGLALDELMEASEMSEKLNAGCYDCNGKPKHRCRKCGDLLHGGICRTGEGKELLVSFTSPSLRNSCLRNVCLKNKDE